LTFTITASTSTLLHTSHSFLRRHHDSIILKSSSHAFHNMDAGQQDAIAQFSSVTGADPSVVSSSI
jgi:hypothetical protein